MTLVVIFGSKNSSIEKVDQKSPNILLVLADDQAWLHTGITGNKVIKTPAFDRVAEESVSKQLTDYQKKDKRFKN